jgi:ribosomal protein S18 acetylase RimI-like enzyme
MENIIMAILLHKLTVRSPRLSDAQAIASLLIACDIAEDGVSLYSEEDILIEWQKPGMNLSTDAQVIIDDNGRFVGYAGTEWDNERGCVKLQACVHPTYRGRGVGTLLLRLAEVRARQYAKYARPGLRVALRNMVNHSNRAAGSLLEREGYTLVDYLWRVSIEIEDALPTASTKPGSTVQAAQEQRYMLTFDVSYPCETGATRIYEPAGWYVVRRYDVYEKELRAGEVLSCPPLQERALEADGITCPPLTNYLLPLTRPPGGVPRAGGAGQLGVGVGPAPLVTDGCSA